MYEELEKHYKEHSETLLKLAIGRVGNTAVAEEVVQEAYTRACVSIRRGSNPRVNFGAWFYNILVNVCNDFLQLERMKGMSGQKNSSSRQPISFDLEDISDTPREIAEENSLDLLTTELWHTISKYPARIRVVLELFYRDGFSHKEIAVLTGIKDKTSRNIVYNFSRGIRG